MNDSRYQRHPSILFGEIGQDMVALSVEQGLCFGMEAVSGDVWRLLEQPRKLAELCECLTGDYSVDAERCRAEVTTLLDEMATAELIQADAALNKGNAPR